MNSSGGGHQWQSISVDTLGWIKTNDDVRQQQHAFGEYKALRFLSGRKLDLAALSCHIAASYRPIYLLLLVRGPLLDRVWTGWAFSISWRLSYQSSVQGTTKLESLILIERFHVVQHITYICFGRFYCAKCIY